MEFHLGLKQLILSSRKFPFNNLTFGNLHNCFHILTSYMNMREMMLPIVVVIHRNDYTIKHCQYCHNKYFSAKIANIFELTKSFQHLFQTYQIRYV